MFYFNFSQSQSYVTLTTDISLSILCHHGQWNVNSQLICYIYTHIYLTYMYSYQPLWDSPLLEHLCLMYIFLSCLHYYTVACRKTVAWPIRLLFVGSVCPSEWAPSPVVQLWPHSVWFLSHGSRPLVHFHWHSAASATELLQLWGLLLHEHHRHWWQGLLLLYSRS